MAHDPKYQFGKENKVYHRNGGYWLPEDEPVVLFRGKDLGTLIAMKAYRQYMLNLYENDSNPEIQRIALEHAETIKERITAIKAYIKHHPEKIGLGCHTCKPKTVTIKL